MKRTIELPNGTMEVEGETQKDLFKEMAGAYEVFGEEKCGLCGCDNIRPVIRKNKAEEEFFEYQCGGFIEVNENGKKVRKACRAYLYLGQNKKGGGLFPVRALDEEGKPDREHGKFGAHRGWSRYRGPKKDESEQEGEAGVKRAKS